MRKVSIVVCFLSLTSLTGAVSGADPPEKWTMAMNMALRGPVHSQLMTVKKLQPDPRSNSHIVLWSPMPWMVFDRNGYFLEQASELAADGAPKNVTYCRYDSDGRELESTQPQGDGTLTRRTEYSFGPFGPTEVRVYVANKLDIRRVITYDSRGNETESVEYDASGAIMTDATWRYDAQNREVDFKTTGPGENFVGVHEGRSYAASGDVGEMTWYNSDDRLVRRAVNSTPTAKS
jgi:hypothetical protein